MSLILSGSDGLSDVDGSAATPAIRGTDANTGIFFPAADTIAFAEGGAESMRIDSSGRLGIGTTSPTTTLNVVSADTAGTDSLGNAFIRTTDSYAAADVGGKLTLGGFYNTTSVYPFAGLAGKKENATLNNVAGYLQFLTTTSAGALTERGRFDATGNFQFNSGYGSVAIAYGCRAWINFNGTSTPAIRASGNVTSITDNGTGNYTINFTTSMPDVNYGTAGSVGRSFASTDGVGRIINIDRYATGSVGIRCGESATGAASDEPVICLSVFR